MRRMRNEQQCNQRAAVRRRVAITALAWGLWSVTGAVARGQEAHDPLLDLMIEKGMVTREEANRVQSEADARRTNALAGPLRVPDSVWKIDKAVKDITLFGDIRLRYEHREGTIPGGSRLELDRDRLALRFGLRGDLFDDFYFGLRLETSTNPRSTWINLGGSSPGPSGKSANGISVGQAFIGYRPESWVDITVGRMPNPMFATSMVWDPDINPEGATERFKYSLGKADFFATFGQFLYQDNNPAYVSQNLLAPITTSRTQQGTDQTFLLSWQGGLNYHFNDTTSAKFAGTLYDYFGLVKSAAGVTPLGVGDAFVGESANNPINGLTSQNGVTYNQVGVNNLLVVDVPVEFDFKVSRLNARIFGDFAYNLEGGDRARAAWASLSAQSAVLGGTPPPLVTAGPQSHAVYAWQAGAAIGNGDKPGLTAGTGARRHTWELRGYWQHVEQYALDPNLLDSDFFEGRGNLQGAFIAGAYAFTDNVIGTVRYGNASRINKNLGTGGNNLDLPQLNPIQRYSILQLDLTLKF